MNQQWMKWWVAGAMAVLPACEAVEEAEEDSGLPVDGGDFEQDASDADADEDADGSCETDEQCDDGEACRDGVCEPPATPCEDDAECEEGESCVASACTAEAECVDDADCEDGATCTVNACVLACEVDGDCSEDESCTNDVCTEVAPDECAEATDCADGEVCVDGACEPDSGGTADIECEADSDCTSNASCDDSGAVARCVCDANFRDDPWPGTQCSPEAQARWSAGFEDGFGDWTVDGGVWAIGAPTLASGPEAHGGAQLAGTVLDDNYTGTVDAYLISPEFEVPEASESPRLRAWLWSYLREGGTNYAAVLVREVGTTPWTEIDRVIGDKGHWSQQRINLSAWAERTVQVAFRLYAYGGAGVDRPGFYVDDVSLETGAASLASAEGFEDGYGDWSVFGGVWEVGEPDFADGPNAHLGSSVAGTVLDDEYTGTVDAYLVSPEFTVPLAEENPRLRLWWWSRLRSGGTNYAAVLVREVGDSGWTELDRVTGDNDSWVQQRYNLSGWAERTVEVGIRLYAYGGNGVDRAGVYIDDFSLETGPAQFPAAESFEEGYGDWSVFGGVWEIGEPDHDAGPDAHTGSRLAGTVLDGNYTGTVDAVLVSPEFTVPAAESEPRMRLWQWIHLRNGGTNYAAIRIREVGTASWTELDRVTGENDSWVQQRLDLSAWAERTVEVGFRLYAYGGDTIDRPGFYLDDVSLETR